MPPTPARRAPGAELPDSLLAAIIAAGLRLGVAGEREDVVRWADREIERRDDVPGWLIDLSLSHDKHILDVIGILSSRAGDVDPVTVCRGLYSLIPDPPADYGYDQYATLAKHLYRLTYDVLEGNWNIPLLREADIAADNFGWIRDGYPGRIGNSMVPMSKDGVVDRFLKFLQQERDAQVREQLTPVHYLLPAAVEDY